MASLATLRANTIIYLGTSSADKAYPSTTLNFLLNNAVNRILEDIQETNPGWLRTTTTLTSSTHSYTLPADFRKALEVRITDKDGVELEEVRDDDINAVSGYAYAISGADHAATLTTGSTVEEGVDLYLRYGYWPSDLSADADQPDSIPRKFHDIIALEAAKEGFGLGGEQEFPATLQDQLYDRTAQLHNHVSRRSKGAMQVRETLGEHRG